MFDKNVESSLFLAQRGCLEFKPSYSEIHSSIVICESNEGKIKRKKERKKDSNKGKKNYFCSIRNKIKFDI